MTSGLQVKGAVLSNVSRPAGVSWGLETDAFGIGISKSLLMYFCITSECGVWMKSGSEQNLSQNLNHVDTLGVERYMVNKNTNKVGAKPYFLAEHSLVPGDDPGLDSIITSHDQTSQTHCCVCGNCLLLCVCVGGRGGIGHMSVCVWVSSCDVMMSPAEVTDVSALLSVV